MANLKVLVSCTCFDLTTAKTHLRESIADFGYEPLVSDYMDIIYDPGLNTHISSVQDVANQDILVLVIGSKFTGRKAPKALEPFDIDRVRAKNEGLRPFDNKENYSITELEVINALENNVPVFTFIERKLWHDHGFYEKNKYKTFLTEIVFPSVEDISTAVYLFEFINFIKQFTDNHNIRQFSRADEITSELKFHFSNLFHRLVTESRAKGKEDRKLEHINNQMSDIKTAVISSITNADLKEIAMGTIKYRRILQLIEAFDPADIKDLLHAEYSWDELMYQLYIIRTEPVGDYRRQYNRYNRIAFIRNDATFYLSRYRYQELQSLMIEWEEFRMLSSKIKDEIYNTLHDLGDSHVEDDLLLEHLDMDIKQFREMGEGGDDTVQ